ncbi:unnamed protein product [Notodromas monacha]|uniref:Cyclin N-terminal domain-containing protein n=1 Tax=Notodromas monacha TaxID=399045 RepID=A0A7R9BR05_9CRUS|nr:unnamed protein product [Notodromas monacha]CAG0919759.1 unnamed protein product [Notodromas monacha]
MPRASIRHRPTRLKEQNAGSDCRRESDPNTSDIRKYVSSVSRDSVPVERENSALGSCTEKRPRTYSGDKMANESKRMKSDGHRDKTSQDSGYISEMSTISCAELSTSCHTSSLTTSPSHASSHASEHEDEDNEWNLLKDSDRVSQIAIEMFSSFGWGDCEQVTRFISQKEEKYKLLRDPNMMEYHDELEPYMRAILLDWMIEVCEAHRLHRETYHLAADYLDRFLSASRDVPKSQLQLSGATALFIAAKLEEVMPPRAQDFAYVTDGACTEDEILLHERTMTLDLFLQIGTGRKGKVEELPTIPNALPSDIVELSRLIEFSLMDLRCHQFSYRQVAASAIYLTKNAEMAIRVSGLKYEDLRECITFMEPFFDVILQNGPAKCHFFENYPRKTAYVLQTKNTNYNMVDAVWKSLAAQGFKNFGYKSDTKKRAAVR